MQLRLCENTEKIGSAALPKLTQLKPRTSTETPSTAQVTPSEVTPVTAAEESTAAAAESGQSTVIVSNDTAFDSVTPGSESDRQASDENSKPVVQVVENSVEGASDTLEPAAAATEE